MRQPDPLKIPEVAELLGISSKQVRRIVMEGYLPSYTLVPGRNVQRLIELSDLLAYAKKYQLPDRVIAAIKKRMKP